MKKLVILMLFLCALIAFQGAYAQNALDALTVDTFENGAGTLICDFSVDSETEASMTWSDADNMYYTYGSPDVVAQAYLEVLAGGGWDSCSYFDDGDFLMSYGIGSAQQFDTLEEYIAAVAPALGAQPHVEGSAPSADDGQDYVLNTNTKKFHYPGCSSVGQMKAKNRQDYHGSRDDLIARGYKPCGSCNP